MQRRRRTAFDGKHELAARWKVWCIVLCQMKIHCGTTKRWGTLKPRPRKHKTQEQVTSPVLTRLLETPLSGPLPRSLRKGSAAAAYSSSESSSKVFFVAFSDISTSLKCAPKSPCSFFFTCVPNFMSSSGTVCLASLRTLTSSPARALSN